MTVPHLKEGFLSICAALREAIEETKRDMGLSPKAVLKPWDQRKSAPQAQEEKPAREKRRETGT